MRHHCLLSPFQLTPYEVKHFLQLAQAHRSPQAVARRARIVLCAHAHPGSQHFFLPKSPLRRQGALGEG
jgi:hypothetical protein